MNDTDLRLAVPAIVWACARMGVHHDQLLVAVSQHFRSAKKCSSLTDWGLCALKWSYDVLDSKQLYQDFRKSLKTSLRRRNLHKEDVHNSQFGPYDLYESYF